MIKNKSKIFIICFLQFCLNVSGVYTRSEPETPEAFTNTSRRLSLSDSGRLFPEMLIEYRIAELNRKTPVELEFNAEVYSAIHRFTIDRKEEFNKILGRAELYFPYIEACLDKYGLPLELKYLAVIESGLNPFAVSKSGAVGIWQFLYNTGNLFDLKINSYIDERRELFLSTEAACRYLQYLHKTFNDWLLVIASYNGGPGEIQKAMERAGGKTGYWEIRPYLSREVQNYIPAFIAASCLMSYPEDFSLVPDKIIYRQSDLDTVHIGYPVSFDAISRWTTYPVDSIRLLNPVYKKDYIPDQQKSSVLVLPKEKIYLFLKNETGIITCSDYNHRAAIQSGDLASIEEKIKLIHIVEKGEFFHKIAMYYECTAGDIKTWNNLSGNFLYPGQKLEIWIQKKDVQSKKQAQVLY
ncbi:MAG: transglycosylase SLT domain-containing protein [Bacteroidales bacterium]|nr:transglycosylase SLT domain-containing protein [Bacteroidales bacterium]